MRTVFQWIELDGTTILWAAIGVLVALIVISVTAALSSRTQDRRDARLKRLAARRDPAGQNVQTIDREQVETGSLTGERLDFLGRLARRLNFWIRPLRFMGRESVAKLRELLRAAGIYDNQALVVLSTAKLLGAGVGIAVAIALRSAELGLPSGIWVDAIWVLGAGLLGSLFPEFVLKRWVRRRQQRISEQLPDAMDLLVIAAEAGLTMERAIARVGEEIRFAAPELGSELDRTAAEISISPDRGQAIENLANRVQVQSVRSMTATLIQGQKYGTPLSQSLRALSAEFRTRRTREIEEKAAKLPTLITIPMIVLIMPALFLVLMGPAILDVLKLVGS